MLCPQPSPKLHMPSRAVPSATPPPPGPAAPRVPRPSPRSPEEVSGVPRGENPQREPGAAEAGLEPEAFWRPLGGEGGGSAAPLVTTATRPLSRAPDPWRELSAASRAGDRVPLKPPRPPCWVWAARARPLWGGGRGGLCPLMGPGLSPKPGARDRRMGACLITLMICK